MIRKLAVALRGALADLRRGAARRAPSGSRRRGRSRRRCSASRSTTTCWNGRSPATRRICSTALRRSQPDFCCGCVETMTSSGSSWSIASRSAETGSDSTTTPVACTPCCAQQVERLVEPAPRRGAARVVVDDVALARLVDRRDARSRCTSPAFAFSSISSTSACETTVSFATTRMCRASRSRSRDGDLLGLASSTARGSRAARPGRRTRTASRRPAGSR